MRPVRRFEFESGSGTGIRTLNLAVNSRLLYRLSYPGINPGILGAAFAGPPNCGPPKVPHYVSRTLDESLSPG